jgi:hypothetical protein
VKATGFARVDKMMLAWDRFASLDIEMSGFYEDSLN